MSDLSVAIVNWNTRELLSDCLSSIYDKTQSLDFDVWVVDNGSTDGSVEMVKQKFPEVLLLENTKNLGFSKANNQVLRKNKSRYVLLLNSDTILLDNALKTLVDLMDSHPDAGASGCQLLNADGSLQLSAGRFPGLWSILFGGEIFNNLYRKVFKNSRFFAEYGLSEEEHMHFQEIDHVKGCCLMLRQSVLEKTGLLDEDIFMYFEEIDLCFQIKKTGAKVLYTPEGHIVHLGGQSSICREKSVFGNLKSQEYYFRKNYGVCYAILLRFVVALGAVIRLPVYLVAYLLSKNGEKAVLKSRTMLNVYTLKWQLINMFQRPGRICL
ncbi:MAG: glycosyltransferase family 2 protein [Nitrospira sp.]|nr:glycosyltransferase family 2 protein [bacterium]MBL7047989.1 glycosyltransferase family 2 protein [Nitrospira sp.]